MIRSALKVNVVTNPSGYMTIGLAWYDGVVEDTFVSMIGSIIKSLIECLAISGRIK